jgi:beta-lactam-binding protein with PASTA domain
VAARFTVSLDLSTPAILTAALTHVTGFPAVQSNQTVAVSSVAERSGVSAAAKIRSRAWSMGSSRPPGTDEDQPP